MVSESPSLSTSSPYPCTISVHVTLLHARLVYLYLTSSASRACLRP